MNGHDPWAAPPASSPPSRPDWGRALREFVVAALPTALIGGVPLSLLWWWLSPRVPVISDGEAVMLHNSEGQEAIAIDGTFLLAGLALGVVIGTAVFLLRRQGGPAVVLGLAVGAGLGSLLAWQLGIWLGPAEDVVSAALAAGPGVVFDAPLELDARGVLLGLPFGALAAHLICVALWGPRDPQPAPAEFPYWGAGGDGRREEAGRT